MNILEIEKRQKSYVKDLESSLRHSEGLAEKFRNKGMSELKVRQRVKTSQALAVFDRAVDAVFAPSDSKLPDAIQQMCSVSSYANLSNASRNTDLIDIAGEIYLFTRVEPWEIKEEDILKFNESLRSMKWHTIDNRAPRFYINYHLDCHYSVLFKDENCDDRRPLWQFKRSEAESALNDIIADLIQFRKFFEENCIIR